MKKIPFMIAIAIVISILAAITTFSNRTEVIATVNRIEKIENVTSSEGNTTTEVYYLLFTSKGTMRLSIHGFLAHPELLGRIKIDSTYTFRTMGVEIPFVEFYPNVVSVK
ncbi:hypothetical protein DXB87_10590 [Phocaeicola plebeius]|uniref:Uncharacterized protein n=1 Tax=Phocaeicola plebeius TaxID=310297 RepID=A0A3E4Z729_9BACT|nr:hypothetical protein [Phocaeicola plebeius]RGM90339.1 hypothetical protein DXB87_10590 [Phocaeicola plebeius]